MVYAGFAYFMIEEIIAAGDHVVNRWTGRATHWRVLGDSADRAAGDIDEALRSTQQTSLKQLLDDLKQANREFDKLKDDTKSASEAMLQEISQLVLMHRIENMETRLELLKNNAALLGSNSIV